MVIVSLVAWTDGGRVRRPADLAGHGVSARGSGRGTGCVHHGSLAALSRGIWKNGERRANLATSITTTPAPVMPPTDHRCDEGAACSQRGQRQGHRDRRGGVGRADDDILGHADRIGLQPGCDGRNRGWARRNGRRPVRHCGLLSDAGGRRAGRFRAAEKQQMSCSGSGVAPGDKTRANGHLARPRCGGVPLAGGFPRHATGPAYPLTAMPASAPGSAGPGRPACCP